jgi:hypothetical protein
MQTAREKFSHGGWWVGLRVECLFQGNLIDSKIVIQCIIPWYGIHESPLFMFFLPGWFSGGETLFQRGAPFRMRIISCMAGGIVFGFFRPLRRAEAPEFDRFPQADAWG